MGLNSVGAKAAAFQGKTAFVEITHRQQPWYAAYMAALFESNRKQIRGRINYAEKLILVRERELSARADDLAEQRALHNALRALRALASCLGV